MPVCIVRREGLGYQYIEGMYAVGGLLITYKLISYTRMILYERKRMNSSYSSKSSYRQNRLKLNKFFPPKQRR